MPTATEYLGYTVTNLGPLTTTFTAASSCASTATDNLIIQHHDAQDGRPLGRAKCQDPAAWASDCYPSADALNSLVSRAGDEWPRPGYVHYFSPAVDCPADWTTAGLAASVGVASGAGTASEAGASLSVSGVFGDDIRRGGTSTSVAAAGVKMAEVHLGVLGPSETVVWCCPSNYTANVNGACQSVIGPLSAHDMSEVCITTIPSSALATITSLDHSSWTPALATVASASVPLESTMSKVDDSMMDDLVLVHTVPAVALVYRDEDRNGTGGDGEDGESCAMPSSHASPRLSLVLTMVGLVAGALLHII